jgi:hypothetical protein
MRLASISIPTWTTSRNLIFLKEFDRTFEFAASLPLPTTIRSNAATTDFYVSNTLTSVIISSVIMNLEGRVFSVTCIEATVKHSAQGVYL